MGFTVDESAALEDRIGEDMARIKTAVLDTVGEDSLSALILGGGYGRGEGGIYVVDGEERVYNDYDFFVVVPYTSRSRRKNLSRQLLQIKEQFEPECGIHVDFGPPMPVSELPQQPYELMFMELKAGHHVVHGPADVLDALPDYDTARPPLEEGARLFMNRGVGLLMADMLLREERPLTQDEHEFVVRNIYKALMALGDGVLFIEERYDPSYVVRRERVAAIDTCDMPSWPQVRAAYDRAMAFKFRPTHAIPEGHTLRSWHGETVTLFDGAFLWFEQQRLQTPGLDWGGYAARDRRLPDLSSHDHLKNLYRNLRHRAGGLPPAGECFLHPRDRILKRLPALLRRDGANTGDEGLVLRLWESFG